MINWEDVGKSKLWFYSPNTLNMPENSRINRLLSYPPYLQVQPQGSVFNGLSRSKSPGDPVCKHWPHSSAPRGDRVCPLAEDKQASPQTPVYLSASLKLQGFLVNPGDICAIGESLLDS